MRIRSARSSGGVSTRITAAAARGSDRSMQACSSSRSIPPTPRTCDGTPKSGSSTRHPSSVETALTTHCATCSGEVDLDGDGTAVDDLRRPGERGCHHPTRLGTTASERRGAGAGAGPDLVLWRGCPRRPSARARSFEPVDELGRRSRRSARRSNRRRALRRLRAARSSVRRRSRRSEGTMVAQIVITNSPATGTVTRGPTVARSA